MADAEASAAPEAGQVKPQPDSVSGVTAAGTPGEDPSGVYRGQMCYAAGGATEPAHCFEAQAISGEWPGRDLGVTIYLAGEVSRSGEVAIHMHNKLVDGSSFAVSDLIGTIHDGPIDAKGIDISRA
jgi:hypothetical protein